MELTEKFRTFDWSQNINDIQNSFDESINQIKDGLYVMVFINPYTDNRVRDNNTKPKTIIRPDGTSLKSGKFEGGLIQRIKNYFDHMRVDHKNNNITHVFNESLKYVKVCDLSEFKIIQDTSNARLLESIWNKSIEHYLFKKNLLLPDQNSRTEWYFTKEINISQLQQFIQALCNYTNGFASHLQNELTTLWNVY